jgi:hypothetical protein
MPVYTNLIVAAVVVVAAAAGSGRPSSFRKEGSATRIWGYRGGWDMNLDPKIDRSISKA